MPTYPSNAIEEIREQVRLKNLFVAQLLLMYVIRHGIRESNRKTLISQLVRELELSEDEMMRMFLLFEEKTVRGTILDRNQRRLGLDPSGIYRHEEYLLGLQLEKSFNRQFFRCENTCYDYTCSRGLNYDLMGPVAPFLFNKKSFEDSFLDHLRKNGMDCLVVCTATLDPYYQQEFRGYAESTDFPTDVFIIDSVFLGYP